MGCTSYIANQSFSDTVVSNRDILKMVRQGGWIIQDFHLVSSAGNYRCLLQ
ncbi:MAG: hypothetical protein ACK5ZC_16720 [Pirellulaceae bacterium]